MNLDIYGLLDKIDNAGYKSYLTGGFVRDFILGYDNYDIDIVTNASISLLLQIFHSYSPKVFQYGTLKFKYKEYNVDVAQFREEHYEDGKCVVKKTDDLKSDYLRRDFTINAIYMDKDLNFIDFDNCIQNCKSLVLRFIGSPQEKCVEDPTRMLRGIYFVLKYNLIEYQDLFLVKLSKDSFLNCDYNALNRILIKILKLNKNNEFIELLDKFNIYDSLFNCKSIISDIKPVDFLKVNKYIFVDKLLNIK